jgi:hypothetical protein
LKIHECGGVFHIKFKGGDVGVGKKL